MKRTAVALALFASVWAADNGATSKKRNRTNQPATRTESLTGCVDQRGETYVLADSAMKPQAKLTGQAFGDDNFARYVGHTVTVYGTVDRNVTPMVVKVVRVEEVKETCR